MEQAPRMPLARPPQDIFRQRYTVSASADYSQDSDSTNSQPTNRKKRRTCEDCKQIFSRPSTLKRHVETAHGTSSPYLCNFEGCGKTFTREESRDRHVKNTHGNAKMTCNNCGDAVRKDGLRDHLKTRSCRDTYAASTIRRNILQNPPTPPNSSPAPVPHTESKTPTDYTPEHHWSQKDGFNLPTPDSLTSPIRSASLKRDDDSHPNSDTIMSESPCNRCSREHEPTLVTDRCSGRRESLFDPPLLDQQVALGELVSEVASWRRVVLPGPLFDRLLPGNMDELCEPSIQAKVAKTDNTLGSFLAYRALRSCREFRLIDFGAQCPLCSSILGTTPQDVVRHAKYHVQRHESKGLECKGCGIDFVYTRDLSFHQKSSGACNINPRWTETLTSDEDDSWVTQKLEEDRQEDRQTFINGLRRWELLQLHWFLSSISQLLSKAEKRKRQHNTDGTRPLRQRVRRGESTLKRKSCQMSPRPNLFLTVRSEIPYSNHDSFDIAALFRNLSLKDPFKAYREARGTSGARLITGLVSSPTSPIRHVEHGFIEACAGGDITQAATLLAYAREHDNLEIAREACRSAIAAGHYKIMKLCLTRTELDLRGPFPECVETWHRTISQPCSKHRNIGRLYKTLLDILFDLNGAQIARILLRSCDESVLEILRGCRKHDDSPLVVCTSYGKLEAVDFLLDIGVPVDWCQSSSGTTALHSASTAGFEAIARRLLESGARVDEPDAAGQTALMRAVEFGHQEIARLLLSYGAGMEPKCSLPTSTCPQLLLDAGVNIDLKSDAEDSLLIHACRQRDVSPSMVLMLLQAGGEIRAMDNQGRTALHWACIHNRVDLARLLFKGGASSGARDGSGATPLTQASKQTSRGSQSNLLAYLIQQGADVNARDDISWTPLMWATYSGKVNEADILLRSGAAVDAVTEECDHERVDHLTSSSTLTRCKRYSALSLAALIADSQVQQEMIKLLFQYSADVGLARRLLQT